MEKANKNDDGRRSVTPFVDSDNEIVMPSLMDIFKAFVLRECKSLKRIVVPEDSIERYKAITPERHHHLFVAK